LTLNKVISFLLLPYLQYLNNKIRKIKKTYDIEGQTQGFQVALIQIFFFGCLAM